MSVDSTISGRQRILMLEYETAKETIDTQIDIVGKIGDRAARMLRITLLITGAIITAIAYTGFQEFSRIYASSLLNAFLIMSTVGLLFIGIFFLISVSVGIGTLLKYTSTPEDIDKLVSNTEPNQRFLEEKLKSYGERISYNQQVLEASQWDLFISDIAISASLFTATSFLALLLEPLLGAVFVVILVLATYTVYRHITKNYPEDHLPDLLLVSLE